MTSQTSNWRDKGLAALALTLVLAVGAAIVSSQAAWPTFVRVAAAALLVLVLPGYALTRAALAGAAVGWPERTATTLGLSLAVSAIGGVAFQFLGIRADLLVWIEWLLGVTAVAIAVALLRELRGRVSARDPNERGRSISSVQALLFTLAAAMSVAAMLFAWGAATAEVKPTAVQLWVLPVPGAQQPTVRLGIHNEASTTVHYRLVLDESPGPTRTWIVDLVGGQVWETTSVLDGASVGHAVVANLFDDAKGVASIRTASYWNAGGTGG
jgi:hypothetical protein